MKNKVFHYCYYILFVYTLILVFYFDYYAYFNEFKYIEIISVPYAILYTLISFVPFIIYSLIYYYQISYLKKSLDYKSKSMINLSVMFSSLFYIVIATLHIILFCVNFEDTVFRSHTENYEDYLLFDKIEFNNNEYLLFPRKELLTKDNSNYYYLYYGLPEKSLIDGYYYDIYLELDLTLDLYQQEKKRITNICDNDEYIVTNIFGDSSIECGYHTDGYFDYGSLYPTKPEHYKYSFVALFDEKQKIVYNLSDIDIVPHFLEKNKNDIQCRMYDRMICRIVE